MVYAAALEGRKRREHRDIVRGRAWLKSLQEHAKALGELGLVL